MRSARPDDAPGCTTYVSANPPYSLFCLLPGLLSNLYLPDLYVARFDVLKHENLLLPAHAGDGQGGTGVQGPPDVRG